MSKAVRLVAALLLAAAVSVGAQTFSTVLNGLVYTFPTSDGASGQVLVNNGAGVLTWTTASPGGSASMPTGMIVFSTVSCATLGYSDYNTGTGFYPVGATTGLGGTVGTGLSSGENRATGNHTHSASGTTNISSGSHTHSLTESDHAHDWDTQAGSAGHEPVWTYYDPGPPDDPYYDWDYPEPWYKGRSTADYNSGTSGVGYATSNTSISASGSVDSFTIGNGGTGTGTNAPYRQLRMCQK
jgi:hypothetical protein